MGCIERKEGWKKTMLSSPRLSTALNSKGGQMETRPAHDPFLLATELVAERDLTEEEWTKGKSIQLAGLQPNCGYLVRLIATNDAGTTHGEIVEVYTKAPKDFKAVKTGEVDETILEEQEKVSRYATV